MSDRRSFGSMSFRLGEKTRVSCYTYPAEGPILDLTAGGWSLSLSPAGREAITDGDVLNAQHLAEAVTTYLAEVERLHAEQAAQSAQVDPGTAAA